MTNDQLLALEAIRTVTGDYVESYRDDIQHDIRALEEFPGKEFLYFIRAHGTHLVVVSPKSEDRTLEKRDLELVESLFEMNTRHYFWKNNTLKKIGREELLSIMKEREVLKAFM